ncbi:hypothetical protein [Butyricicoccus porcorum]|uniref:hypothetical protein n=1 Tax=Butyricicoccus TaxID=580596 RepID=UPI0023554612|nr:hypothetical protein [Butyricicoccus porcorum]MDD6986936.1 hypothetical protein [Butyricicoccus porcorum]
MKRKTHLLSALLTGILTLVLCGCGKASTPTIRQSDLSQDARQISTIFGDDAAYFDFTTDDTISHAVLTVYTCQNGSWTEQDNLMELDEIQPGSYRLGIRRMDDTITAALLEGDASSIFNGTVPPENIAALDDGSISGATQLEAQDIIAGEEIPLLVRAADRDALEVLDLDFRSIHCDAGIAFTITFT